MVICICTCVGSTSEYATAIVKRFMESYRLHALLGDDAEFRVITTEVDDKCVV